MVVILLEIVKGTSYPISGLGYSFVIYHNDSLLLNQIGITWPNIQINDSSPALAVKYFSQMGGSKTQRSRD